MRQESFKSWLEKASDQACKLGHAFVKRHERPATLPASCQAYHDPLELMASKASCWSAYWRRDADRADKIVEAYNLARDEAMKQDSDTDLVSPQRVRKIIVAARKGRATSVDSLSMGDLKCLPPQAYAGLANVFRAVGTSLALPAQILCPAVRLIPKPNGGDRPITITSTFYMILMILIDSTFSIESDINFGTRQFLGLQL